MMLLSHQEIIKQSNSIPFSDKEMEVAVHAVKTRRSKNHDLAFGHPDMAMDTAAVKNLADSGVLLFYSQFQLKQGFMFTKLNAGRSFFGKQKAVYACYLEAELNSNEWTQALVFKSWHIAATSMGNVYRGNGL